MRNKKNLSGWRGQDDNDDNDPARARSARARRARALRALGLLLADGALTVGWGKTFWGIDPKPSRKRA